MTKLTKILCCILAPLGMFFCMVGYASLSSTLTMHGSAQLEMPNAVYIAEIKDIEYTNASRVGTTGDPTNINFPSTKFRSYVKFNAKNSSVSFSVRIVNGTDFPQYFDIVKAYEAMEGVEGTFNSNNIEASITLEQKTRVEPNGGFVDCRVTLKADSGVTRNMLYNIEFTVDPDDFTEAVSKDVTDKFAQILNNQLGDITYTYTDGDGTEVTETIPAGESYEALTGDKMNNADSGAYIGNVAGAEPDDVALVNALFGDVVNMNINGQDVPVKVMIKEEDVYGDEQKEMVLYFTADTLDTDLNFGELLGGGHRVPVYVAVYTPITVTETETDADGNPVTTTTWEPVGDIYAGTAVQSNYVGSYLGKGSFITDYWRSTEAYYGAPARSDLAAILAAYKNQQQ